MISDVPVTIMTYREFDTLVKETFPHIVGFSFCALIECGNDTDHYFSNVTGKLSAFDAKCLIETNTWSNWNVSPHAIFEALVLRGALKPGNFLVQVSW